MFITDKISLPETYPVSEEQFKLICALNTWAEKANEAMNKAIQTLEIKCYACDDDNEYVDCTCYEVARRHHTAIEILREARWKE